MAKDERDRETIELIPVTRGRGRPAKYATESERKAARAAAARARRARQKAAGYREVRRLVKKKPETLKSEIIDLSAIPEHRR